MSLQMTKAEREALLAGLHPADVERDRRPLARRDLGREVGDRYIEETSGAGSYAGSIPVSLRPERWLTTGYAKQ